MKISKGRLKQIIQEEMNRVDEAGFPDLTGDGKVTQADILKGRGVELDEQVTPENMMLAMEALAKILSNPVLAAGVASLLGKAMYDKLQAMAQKDAEVMAQRPELDEAEEA
tara:strand:- start:927 stop:1259 length:333 start_codon:yes stop_codon:yes gene_type:complete